MDYKQTHTIYGQHKTVTLVNPWTEYYCGDYTWFEIVSWANKHVHDESDRAAWLREAADYFVESNGILLGRMIIGS